jgi:hypothetical protein
MTEASAPSSGPGTPHEILAGLGDLTRRVRAAQRGTWFPLLLLGGLLLGGILLDRFTFSVHTSPCPDIAGNADCIFVKQGSPLYWTLGLALVYAATAFFYIRRARKHGVGSPVRPYVLAGIVIILLVAPTRFWNNAPTTPGAGVDFWGLHFHATSGLTGLLSRLTGRATTIGLPLLVLSWVERSRALLLFTLAYLTVELVPITLGSAGIAPTSPWWAMPRLAVPAAFLLLGALGFALAQQPRRSGAS